jgi:monoterpene epsilon-lactone hydrolase
MPNKPDTSPGRSQAERYEILVRGAVGPTLLEAFPALTAHRRGRDTVLTGPLPDHCALYGVIHELEALGLELLEVGRPEPSDKSP